SVLLVSIDGLAPRHITPANTPSLTSLARRGASCFQARTVMPSVTLPAHASMVRSAPPDVHGILDNTPTPPLGPPSILSVARAAGRSTSVFQSWLPLDALWEPDALSFRLTRDEGYDQAVDATIVDAAIARVDSAPPGEVMFVYLSYPDPAGHDHGWDSEQYLAAAAQADRDLGHLVNALPADWSVVVTTDHGGHGRRHGTDCNDDMETFVVARGPRITRCAGWATASILDIAPTVADLADISPDSGWVGHSLIGHETPRVDELMALLAATEAKSYGERVNMLDHVLQSAAVARQRGASDDLVLAALLHDVGHVFGVAGDWGLPGHADVGARCLQALLPPSVVEPIRLHVDAKRYRVAVDSAYHAHLSLASQMSLQEQGGPFSPAEVKTFNANPYADDAVMLREFDDDGKVDGLEIPALETYRPLLAKALLGQPVVDGAWARHACRCAECRDAGNDQHLLRADELIGWQVTDDRAGPPREVDLVHDNGERHTAMISVEPQSQAHRTVWDHRHGAVLRAGVSSATGDLTTFARQLAEFGIAIATDVATKPGEILRFARRIGFVRNTNYGMLFDVVAEPDPINLAYTPVGLPLHTDNPYRRPCPTVQLLHCLSSAAEGGASQFADGFRAAEVLRAQRPDDFAVLTNTMVDFRFHDATVDLRARRPIIHLDADGVVSAVSINNRSMEAPTLSTVQSTQFYRAYASFAEVLASPESVIELTLKAGELVGFDNRRILHGRGAFAVTAHRHLQGCYVDMDAVRSLALGRN
ncbi:MAG: HD domain-containing protein, partial [Acidimicrobiaceae bacterium]|nr:HD domain-containing protein [Acidimicrobiaceae bacterium]